MNQIISTTHELQLLDQNLRVDQIYLFEKDFEGISTLDSMMIVEIKEELISGI